MSYEQLMQSVDNLAEVNVNLQNTVQGVQVATEASRDAAQAFAIDALAAASTLTGELLVVDQAAAAAAEAKVNALRLELVRDLTEVTLEHFGGAGGVADDTNALTLALTTGKPIRLVKPFYSIRPVSLPAMASFTSDVRSQIRPLTNAATLITLQSGGNYKFTGVDLADPNLVMSSADAVFINGVGVTGFEFIGCRATNMYARPIRLQNASNVNIQWNVFADNRPHTDLSDERSSELYLIDNLRKATIAHNIFDGKDTALWGSRENAVFVHAVTAGSYWEDVHIHKNKIQNYRRFGVGVGTQDTALLDQPCKGVWITDNTILRCGQQGIKMKAGGRVFVNNNIVDTFELIMPEVPDSLNGGIFMQITPESTCNGNRVYGRNTLLWSGLVRAAAATTVDLPASPAGTWTDAVIAATYPGISAVIGKLLYIRSGTGAGQWRRISGWVKATNKATVPAWTTIPDTTSVIEVWSNPSVGIKYRGNNTGTSTWVDSRAARGFQSAQAYVEECEVAYGFSEPLFNSQFSDLTSENCAITARSYSTGTKLSRGLSFNSLKGRYKDYPNPNNTAAIQLSDMSQVEFHDLHISGATNDVVRLQNMDLKLFGGTIEGAGGSVANRYGLALYGDVNLEAHGTTIGGVNAGAGQAYAVLYQGANNKVKHIGGDLTGNAVSAFNPASSGSLLPPKDAVFIGVKGAGNQPGSLVLGDETKTLFVGTDPELVIFATPLTANRSVSFTASTGLVDGAQFRVVRAAGATGAFNLTVNALASKVLAVGTFAEFAYSTALAGWQITNSGTL